MSLVCNPKTIRSNAGSCESSMSKVDQSTLNTSSSWKGSSAKSIARLLARCDIRSTTMNLAVRDWEQLPTICAAA